MAGAPLHLFYGGTFDPVHCGHVGIACAARDLFDAEVALVPAADPPHKRANADAAQRATMLELAIAARPGLRVDRRELAREGASYTVDTLRGIRRELGDAVPVAWLIGGDSLRQLASWHDWRQLFALAHLVVVERPHAAGGTAPLAEVAPEVEAEVAPRRRAAADLSGAPAGFVATLPLDRAWPQSSSAIRSAIAAAAAAADGCDDAGAGDAGGWRDQVPAAVAAFITRQRLYGCAAGAGAGAPL